MIDKDQFAIGMGLLGGAFSRDVDAAVSVAYYSVLNPRMTTAQFVRAVELALESETFWPAPAVLLAKIRPSGDDEAERALRHVNATLGAHGGFQHTPFAAVDAFDAPTKAGIKAVGGLRELAGVTEDRYPRLVKRFVDAYHRTKAEAATPKLPQPKTEARVEQLVADIAKERSA
jgi:hypothetical protein